MIRLSLRTFEGGGKAESCLTISTFAASGIRDRFTPARILWHLKLLAKF